VAAAAAADGAERGGADCEGASAQAHQANGGTVLKELSPVFDQMHSAVGRPSIPPERLLKSSPLMALYTVRSERMLCEQLDCNLLFRWILDLEVDELSFDHSTFSRNRTRLLAREVAGELFRGVAERARAPKLLSSEHCTVDGTLIEAWASLKSFKRRDEGAGQPLDDPGNPTVNFHGARRGDQTRRSSTAPGPGWRARVRARKRGSAIWATR
jgi:transposase